jgi:hypothetical protein
VELGFQKRGRPLNSIGAGLLNHETSKNSVMSFWMKISLWVFKIRGFEGGIGDQKTWETPEFHRGGAVKSPNIKN